MSDRSALGGTGGGGDYHHHHHSSSHRERDGRTSGAATGALLIHSLYIINKAGGLIYQKDFSPVPKLSTNDYLRLASTFHSLHAITARGIHVLPAVQKDRKGAAGAAAAAALAASQAPDALPRNQEGIQSIEARDFRLHCFQTLTGIKFLLVASPNFSATTLDKVLQGVYLNYSDYVLKNPFYELEMPIRIEAFDTHLLRLIQGAVGGGGGGGGGSGGGGSGGGGVTSGGAGNTGDRRDK